ncbi:MAG: beta-glucosidase [Anaerolineales bacterium]|nr:beta-glucosidase [Anaerolineales bacterium]
MTQLSFPKEFLWGVAASAYQIEGAYKEDGKGESIWDRFVRWPAHVLNGNTGDVACDHYHRMPQDVALFKELGIPCYSFTISWTRILPHGYGEVNAKGLGFYDRLVDELLAAGIKPMATLYHWELPQTLQDLGGWPNRDTVHRFAEYAQVVFAKLADRVELWATHNEPWVAAFLGYGKGLHAPGICDYSQAYQTAHHLMLAHGKAVQVFREGGHDGQIGLILNLNGLIPASDSDEDRAATQREHDETHALFLDPLFHGNYPQALFDYIGPHQPKVQAGDAQIIAQPIDFLGLNYYNTDYISFDVAGGLNKSSSTPYSVPGWGRTEMNWGIHPYGLKAEVLHIKEKYGNPKLYITENGCALADTPDDKGFVADWSRIDFLRAHLRALHEAIAEGANVHGYFVWSIFDNFEWAQGYGPRFGLVRVDYETLVRTPKQSAYWYRDVIASNTISI